MKTELEIIGTDDSEHDFMSTIKKRLKRIEYKMLDCCEIDADDPAEEAMMRKKVDVDEHAPLYSMLISCEEEDERKIMKQMQDCYVR